jgi:hypothetical protein
VIIIKPKEPKIPIFLTAENSSGNALAGTAKETIKSIRKIKKMKVLI